MYFIFPVDETLKRQPIFRNSYKSKRAARFVSGSEVMAFKYGSDMAYSLKSKLEKFFCDYFPLNVISDSQLLYEDFAKATSTT